jgi:hypothetical protein
MGALKIARDPGRAAKDPIGAIGDVLEDTAIFPRAVIQRRKEKKAEKELRSVEAGKAAARLAESEAKRAEAEESVRQQKEKARRRTIFAGQDVREGLFRRRLGAGQAGRANILGG